MSKEQQEQLLEFIGNFVACLNEDGYSRECALDGAKAAVACLFGVVWDLKPDNVPADEIAAFVAAVIEAALTKFYGSATVGLQA
jgi:hypothetical protein